MPALMLALLVAVGADVDDDALVQVLVFDHAGSVQTAAIELGTQEGTAPVDLRLPAGRWSLVVDGTVVALLDLTPRAVVDVIVTLQPDGAPAVVDVERWASSAATPVPAAAVPLVLAPAKPAPRLPDELEELTVSLPHISGGAAQAVTERREQKQLVDVLGAQQMAKSGDGDAAAALRRVTGLTVVGGRYVYVRGLGDRYSSTLVNGAPLPSPEPEKRVVPLDLFPVALLESMVVQKTWSPDLPGEFGGGSVQLRTRNGPDDEDKPLLSLGVNASFVAGTSLREHALTPGGRLDALGFDDGSRALPVDVKQASDRAPIAEGNPLTAGGLDRATLERLGESLPRAWSTRTALVPPGLSMNATVGDTFDTPAGDVGALLALTWSQDFLHTDTQRALTAVGAGGAVVVTDDFDISATELSVGWGSILGLSWLPAAGHKLKAVTLLNHTADDEARVVDGYDADADAAFRLTRLRFVERQLFVQQLVGDNALPWAPVGAPAELHWRAHYALATRSEPDQRTTRYDDVGDAGHPRFVLSDRSEANQRLYSGLVDHVAGTQVALRTPFSPWGGLDAHVDAGAALAVKLRDVDTRRFRFLPTGARAADLEVRAQAPEQVFSPRNIGADGFTLTESTRNTDNHTGSAVVAALFTAVDLALTNELGLQGGVRLEGSRLEVTTFELFNAAATPIVAELNNLDLLPALTLAWIVVDDVSVKAAMTRTVVRPELRELSPALYTDVAGGRARFGNPLLQETGIVHVDVRADWALGPTDGLSLALFAKHFDQPIESVVTAGADQALTAANVDSALNLGVEIEGRLALRTVVDVDVPLLGGLWFGGNAALVWSRVSIGAEQQGTLTSTERGLEGQSPWIANLQVGTDDDDRGFSASALYNVFGPRIVEVGALGLPDTLEQPFHQVDVVARQRLPWGLGLSLKASNLLDLPATRRQGSRVVDSVSRGRAFSLGVSFTL
ncbi:MAG: TonB-dependent receptor [Deltaproteobacteria bacterium]|nr:TonB-dependent receptor [Deltaproteobacteria bacterium]